MQVGIELLNVFGGTAFLDVRELAEYRQLDLTRFDNLLMKQKTVALPYEDPVTFAVNAAKPIIDSLSDDDKNSIELVITCTESGIDFGKSISTYVHQYLGLQKNCRLFEIKQACYSGTAGLQMAVNFILSQSSPGAKALVIATDISRFLIPDGGSAETEEWTFAEPSGGSGAVAFLVSDQAKIFQIDVGASGYYSYEVMDTCRPFPDGEIGDSDLSLMSYLDCCQASFANYQSRVENIDYRDSFNRLVFHTPFGGMVKGAHRTMMRKIVKAKPAEIEEDFKHRVEPGLNYCQRVGNIMGATVLLALASTIDNMTISSPERVGVFSYGSGCSSEFYSGVVTSEGQKELSKQAIDKSLDQRYALSISQYETILRDTSIRFGERNIRPNFELVPELETFIQGNQQLYLDFIDGFHRKYQWA